MKRDLDDLLRRPPRGGQGQGSRSSRRDPAEDAETPGATPRTLGIQPVQFNVVGKSELQVKEGYLGLVVQYADGSEAIPFVRRTDDLEYRLAAAIRGLTRGKKPLRGTDGGDGRLGPGRPDLRHGAGAAGQELHRGAASRWVTAPSRPTPSHTLIIAGQPDSLLPGRPAAAGGSSSRAAAAR